MTIEAYIPWLIKRVLLEEQHIKKKKTWGAREEEHLFQNQCFLTVWLHTVGFGRGGHMPPWHDLLK